MKAAGIGIELISLILMLLDYLHKLGNALETSYKESSIIQPVASNSNKDGRRLNRAGGDQYPAGNRGKYSRLNSIWNLPFPLPFRSCSPDKKRPAAISQPVSLSSINQMTASRMKFRMNSRVEMARIG